MVKMSQKKEVSAVTDTKKKPVASNVGFQGIVPLHGKSSQQRFFKKLRGYYQIAAVRILNAADRGGWFIKRIRWSTWSLYIVLRRYVSAGGYSERKIRISNHESFTYTPRRIDQVIVKASRFAEDLSWAEGSLSGVLIRSETVRPFMRGLCVRVTLCVRSATREKGGAPLAGVGGVDILVVMRVLRVWKDSRLPVFVTGASRHTEGTVYEYETIAQGE